MDNIEPSLKGVISLLTRGESPWPLVMVGGVGTGKTCAALCLCDYVPGAVYSTLQDVFDTILACDRGVKSWRNPEGQDVPMTSAMYWDVLVRAPLVVVDEVGQRDRVSDPFYAAFFKLIEQRSSTPFVVISNLSLDRIEAAFDYRITSRLTTGTVAHMDGPDRRVRPC